MPILALLLVFPLAPSPALKAQGSPNLNGTWTLQEGTGGRASAVFGGPRIVVVQSKGQITVTRSLARQDVSFTLKLDGSENKILMPAFSIKDPPLPFICRATWRGETLEVTFRRAESSATNIWTETLLLVDGKFLTVARSSSEIVGASGAGFKQRDIYQR